jgi:hypothetical protein
MSRILGQPPKYGRWNEKANEPILIVDQEEEGRLILDQDIILEFLGAFDQNQREILDWIMKDFDSCLLYFYFGQMFVRHFPSVLAEKGKALKHGVWQGKFHFPNGANIEDSLRALSGDIWVVSEILPMIGRPLSFFYNEDPRVHNRGDNRKLVLAFYLGREYAIHNQGN